MNKKLSKVVLGLVFSLSLSSCSIGDFFNNLFNDNDDTEEYSEDPVDVNTYRQEILTKLNSFYNDLDANLYDNSGKNQLSSILNRATSAINSSYTSSKIQSIYNSSINLFDDVLNIDSKSIYLEELEIRKTEAIDAINNLKSNYRSSKYSTNINKINTKVDSSISKINASSTFEEINEIRVECENYLKSIKSDTQLISFASNNSKSVSMYAVNDFHGAVTLNGSEKGILQVASFLKEKEQENNTLIINSGDMFQGSIESNYNHGELLTNIMNDVQFDSFTLGNHEFDWSSSYIEKNRALKDNETGYSTPFLGANIYEVDPISKETTKQASSLCQEFTISILDNGLSVGIIGVIGEDQITSISSQNVSDITFLNPTPIIKTLSDKLRTEFGCDLIVVSVHGDVSQIAGSTSKDTKGITNISNVSGERYVDAVFCAHSHAVENYTINGVPFMQAGSNGKYVGNITLNISSSNITSSINTNCNIYSAEIDDEIEYLYNQYTSESDIVGSEVIKNVNKYLSGYTFTGRNNDSRTEDGTLPNLASKAIGYYARSKNINVDYAMCNDARSNITAGILTYAKLYKSLPFDNLIYVFKCKGKDIINEYKYNSIYCFNTEMIEKNRYYTIATIDYLAIHSNSSKVLDYFPSMDVSTLKILDYNYREITRAYIKGLSSFNSEDYSIENDTRFILNTDGSVKNQPSLDNPSFVFTGMNIPSFSQETVNISFIKEEYEGLSYNVLSSIDETLYLKGTIKSIDNSYFGKMIIEDSSGSLSICSLYDSSSTLLFKDLPNKPKVNDEIIVELKYLINHGSSTPDYELVGAKLLSINGVKQ